jgi:hypothetical protein
MSASSQYVGKKIKLTLKMKKRRIGVVDYEAKIEPFMERFIKIYGRLRYDKKQVERIIRRASRAKRPLPKDVGELAISAVRHVLSSFNSNKVEEASVCMNDVGNGFEITVCASVYYRIQGIAELKVILRFADGWHVAEKVIHMPDGELKDYADRLMREIVDVAKYAYNIYEAAQLLKPGQSNA